MRAWVVVLSMVATIACGGSGDEATTTADDSQAGSTATSTATTSAASASGALSCDDLPADPAPFVTPEFTAAEDLVELRRGPFDAGWLRIDGAEGCLIELAAPDGTRRLIGLEVYVFDSGIVSPADFAQTFVDANPDGTAAELLTAPAGGVVLTRVTSGASWAVVVDSGDRMAFVQASGAQGDVRSALVDLANAALSG